ncbi:uncharacterized protein Fot_33069 [Forsythia ovata]|uniref:Uncharacterized protein n=1 Tax=Forsythia ovata TaxID=205694 RepID=A0ABD1T9N0_9LAMI
MSSTREFLLVKEEQREINKFDIVEDPDSSQDIVSDVKEEESEKRCLAQSQVAEDDEGFKTPTLLDHKIPVIKQCPAAPRKTRPSSTKRKLSPTRINQAEIESMFPSRPRDDNEHKIKKARKDDAE